jgi:hypothetical protein
LHGEKYTSSRHVVRRLVLFELRHVAQNDALLKKKTAFPTSRTPSPSDKPSQHRLSKWRRHLDIHIHSGIDLFIRHRNLLAHSTQQYTQFITGFPEGPMISRLKVRYLKRRHEVPYGTPKKFHEVK